MTTMNSPSVKKAPTQFIKRPPGNVLIVEDDHTLAEALANFLLNQKYGVRIVGTRDEALIVLTMFLYDVVILDLRMPGMSVKEFLSKARASTLRTNFVVISALPSVKEDALELGIQHVLKKPFLPEDLLTLLNEL